MDKVEIQGLIGQRPAQILPRLKVQAGKPYSSIDARADLKELSRTMRTASISTVPGETGGVTVIYNVTEFPRFRKLQVIGNQAVKTERIETLARLKPGDVLDQNVLRSLRQALREEYRVRGMPQAKIDLKMSEVPENPEAERKIPQADLQIVITEGTPVVCKDVIIRGNQAFSAMRLRFQMETTGSKAWGLIKNYYDDQMFEDDLAKLRDFYAAHGYFDASVGRGLFEQQPGKVASVSPVIQISEGQRYTFGHATVQGARLFSKADVAEPFKPLEGQAFDGKKFVGALDKLRALYQDHGLLTTEIEPKYEYDTQHKVLNMTIQVGEKGRIYVGKIRLVRPAYDLSDEKGWFRGWYNRFSPPVKEETVLREVLLKPGDIYNKRLERDSIRHLAQLGVFNTSPDKLKAEPQATDENSVFDMVITAEETNTGAISGGVGYGDFTGPFVFASFSERNVGGVANAFSVQGMLGTRDSSVIVSYLNRHLHDSDNSLLTRLYLQNQWVPGYRATTFGGTTELGVPLNSEWTAYLRPRLEAVRLHPWHEEDKETAEDLNRSYAVATGRIRVMQDTRYPLNQYREGYMQNLSVEAGYAGGELLRVEAERDQYIPLTQSLTYRMLAFGGIMPYNRDTVPIHERYFMGGDTDMRGFKFRGAGYFDAKDKDVPIGGAAKLLVKNELLYPIYDPVSGVAFVDIGTLAKSPVIWQGPRISAGLGLRFDMKQFKVALDFAAPIIKQSDDQTRFFHFSLQSQF